MKYKSCELERPPLGEIVVVKRAAYIHIGEYYIDWQGKRDFNSRIMVKPDEDYEIKACIHTWSPLPKFKSIKKEKPPVGVDVLMAAAGASAGVINAFIIKHFLKGQQKQYVRDETPGKETLVDAWLPLEAFDEE